MWSLPILGISLVQKTFFNVTSALNTFVKQGIFTPIIYRPKRKGIYALKYYHPGEGDLPQRQKKMGFTIFNIKSS